jgi:hypothetical protein
VKLVELSGAKKGISERQTNKHEMNSTKISERHK